jgi:hypothetical protein
MLKQGGSGTLPPLFGPLTTRVKYQLEGKSMFITILLVIGVTIAVVLIYAAFKPKTFLLERRTTISAPPDRVFGLINDLKAFNSWNPFAKQDPAQTIHYEAITAGRGAAYRWEGAKSGVGVCRSATPSRHSAS